ncbi:hypothetical protein AUR64_01230 [Haloprofundus marisrubri]|uniref:Peptidase M48 domain-containing protein n=1 Tax=Haloprofundus marisrubri TaxID=1514971 RepID=A0A0W1R3F4_9EURY|nr:M48 family metalloprotease [Haloprofundus marisrubri]KTG07886.1 hypothetical protein AUR64_01230 [Haloprofundus marisrubri]
MALSRSRSLLLRTVATGGYVLFGYVAVAFVLYEFAGPFGLLLALPPLALLLALLVFGPSLTLSGVDAVRVDHDDRPTLLAAVDRLARQADVPTPAVAVVDDAEANAFTVGSGSGATLCVTTGLSDALSGDELEAVLAHELVHAVHWDSVVLSVVAFPLLSGRTMFDAAVDVGSQSLYGAVFGLVFVLPLSIAAMALSAPAVYLLTHTREFAADRGASVLTGNPAALASALRSLDGHEPQDEDLRTLGTASAFCIVPPVSGVLPWTHPPTEKRVERLRQRERETETS